MERHNTATIKLRRTCIFLCIILPILTACASSSQIPQDHYYRLPDPTHDSIYPTPVFEGKVLIKPIAASGILDERSMLYVDANTQNELKYYPYRHWIDAPSKLIHQHLINYLDATGAAKVALSNKRSNTNITRISITLLRFERVVSKEKIEARVMLKINHSTPGNTEVSNLYSSTVAATSTRVYDTVSAFGAALENTYSEWLREVK